MGLIVLGRWLWAEWTRRKIAAEKTVLAVQKAELVGQVKQLSLRPPAMPPTDLDVVITHADDQLESGPKGPPTPPPIDRPPTSKS